MQISAENVKVITNNANGFNIDISVNNEKLKTVHSFKYLGAVTSDKGSNSEVLSRIAQTTAALTKQKILKNNKNTSCRNEMFSKTPGYLLQRPHHK